MNMSKWKYFNQVLDVFLHKKKLWMNQSRLRFKNHRFWIFNSCYIVSNILAGLLLSTKIINVEIKLHPICYFPNWRSVDSTDWQFQITSIPFWSVPTYHFRCPSIFGIKPFSTLFPFLHYQQSKRLDLINADFGDCTI